VSTKRRPPEEPKAAPGFKNEALRAKLSKWKSDVKAAEAPPATAPKSPLPRTPPPPPKPTAKSARAAQSAADDDALFRFAMEEVDALPARKGAPPAEVTGPPPRIERADEDAEALARLAELVATGDGLDLADTDGSLEGIARGVDEALLVALRRGDFSVQGHVDLHGLSAEAGRAELEKFLVESRRRGHRCVVVVHGRGLHSQDQVPVIKERMSSWMTRGRLSKFVLAFATARPVDGGAGALYVLLRR
jgi:DNA-nicking Smr family endonuclease